MSIRHLALALAITGLAACTANAPKKVAVDLSPEEAVAQRATERWQYIIDGDFEAAYQYLTPGARAVMSFQQYAARMVQAQLRWTGVKPAEVICEDAETCKAEMTLDITVHAPGIGQRGTQTAQSEDWLKSGGQWYYLPQNIQ